MINLITPNWAAPSHIKAFSTTRLGGISKAPYQGLNLGLHVGDEASLVLENRKQLTQQLGLTSPLNWLNQTHSTQLIKLDNQNQQNVEADASWTTDKKQVCVVMTADCLPVVLTNREGSFVAAIHAGWRGLCDGIIEKAVKYICRELSISTAELLVWLGPCIGKEAFEVGAEVKDAFIAHDKQAEQAFSAYNGRYLANLHQLARLRLAPFQVAEVTSSEHCTFSEADLFYSYRRDGTTGRMATLISIG